MLFFFFCVDVVRPNNSGLSGVAVNGPGNQKREYSSVSG